MTASRLKLRGVLVVLVTIVIPYLLLVLSMCWMLLPAGVYELESRLATAEVLRSTCLWIFDATLWVAMLWGLFLLLLLYTAVRARPRAHAFLLIAALLVSAIPSFQSVGVSEAERKPPLAKIVIIVTLDGTRADVFWRVGTFFVETRDQAVWARRISCTYPTETIPNHISILTGTWPQVHGAELNPTEYRRFWLLRSYHKSRVDDIFSIAKRYGVITLMFTATSIPVTISEYPDRVWAFKDDSKSVETLIEYLRANRSDPKRWRLIERYGLLVLLHLKSPDEEMHRYGTFSREYESAVRMCSELVRQLYNEILALGIDNETVIIVTADHGGYGYGHAMAFPPLVSEVPLWMWGCCFKRGVELGGLRLVDIAAIVSFILGLPAPSRCVGVVPYRAFNETLLRELRGISDPVSHEVEEIRGALFLEFCEVIKYLTVVYVVLVLLVLASLAVRRTRVRRRRPLR